MVASGTAESGYGADDTGLVWGYLFTPDHAPTPIDCAHALQRLSDSMSPESDASLGFVWLHFSLSNAASPRWLREHLELPDSFYDSLHERVGSTRLEIENGAVVAVVHDVVFNTTFDAESISTVTLYMEPRVIVSARLRPLRSLDRLRAAVRLGLNLRSTAELLALPINLTAGLLGMNVGGIPFAQHSEGFLLIVSGLTLVTGLLAYFFLLRRRD